MLTPEDTIAETIARNLEKHFTDEEKGALQRSSAKPRK